MPIKQIILVHLCLVALVHAEPLTLPLEKRPDWLRQDGIVMAGSWEALPIRARIYDDDKSFAPTTEQCRAYEQEHSAEMIAKLKALGVNFVMIHCYRGAGLEAEHESMLDAVRFAKRYHKAGIKVGVYNYSGTIFWEKFFKEVPESKDWVLLDANGNRQTYGKQTFRYRWNRNHPDAQAFYRNIIRFAVNDIKADLLHFDNYDVGPGYDDNSVQRFHSYLRKTFTPEQLKAMGIDKLNSVQPPMTGPPDNLLRRAWLDFSCQSLADSYYVMTRYARTLRKDILVECNPMGARNRIHPPVDHGRLVPGGDAYWDEGVHSGYINGQLHTRIREYKIARAMNNINFNYSITPLEIAEAMAFNLDCLGCICWYEYGKIVVKPYSREPISPNLAPFIHFFHKRRDLLLDAKVVADVAVLRSFPSQVFSDSKYANLTYQIEQTLIENHACFQIIYDPHLNNLKRYRALVLAGCVALSDRQVEQIRQYIDSGGRVCIIGPAATHNEWMLGREKPALDNLPIDSIVRIAEDGDVLKAIHRTCRNKLSLSVKARHGLCAELTEQPDRRLVHLVNYRNGEPVRNIAIRLSLPAGRQVKSVLLAGPERGHDLELTFKEQAGAVTFTVPEVNVYEIAVVTMK